MKWLRRASITIIAASMVARYNKSLEFAPALGGPAPDGLSAPLQARRSAMR
ncbi:hypothetical protein FIU96_19360 [Marinobacter sp. THAF39]|nr:hypothetical protein FIV08_19455 [Marinobacter sp. THAF197a]QFT52811.1 hypothetical protein FIU96_19360 [Marinobacter sp. THAF39]